MDLKQVLLHPADARPEDAARIGGKAQGLLRLGLAGARVPSWFVVTTEAFQAHLAQGTLAQELDTELAALATLDPAVNFPELERRTAALRQRIESAPLDLELSELITAALPELGAGPLAVRSSMVGEDSATRSFAGQLDTFLFQRSADVPHAVLRCWASAFTARAVAYRALSGEPSALPRMGVVIQRMISGITSGVMFTKNPLSGRTDQALLSACWGTGEGVVSGRCNSDEFVCDQGGHEVLATIADKDTQIVHRQDGTAGTEEVAVPEAQRHQRCLTAAEVATVARAGLRLAEVFGAPLDLEWTFAADGLHFLQARPITARAPVQAAESARAAGAAPLAADAPEGPLTVWDNSNIQESYCGITTPLTFSYARGGYASAYEQLMRIGRLPERVIAEQRPVLHNLLGLLNGRVYYNINNWYRMLSHLPSFRRNKQDMEKMMGLDSPVDFVTDESASLAERLRRIPWLLSVGMRMVVRFASMGREVSRFIAKFDLEYQRIDRRRFVTASFSELLALLAQVKNDLAGRWHTPLINDLYVMMASGRLRRMVERAVGLEAAPRLLANLLGGEAGIESTEPTRQVLQLSAVARSDAGLSVALRSSETTLLTLKKDYPQFAAAIEHFIERYGDRCMGELKLETISLREDPGFLLRLLRGYLDRPDLDADAIAAKERRLRDEAEAELRRAVGVFRFGSALRTVRAARAAVKYRENLRLLRTRVFGLVRDLYRAIGDRLHTAGRLDSARDIFFLTVEEVDSYHAGTAVSADTAALVRARKTEYAEYAALELPHRIETRGAVYHGNKLGQPIAAVVAEPGECELRGIGCYPGIVEAPARIIMNPTDDLALSGRILVTLRTDPGWAPLFPLARGILVERGSSLSHSAILARELGIPAVVGVPGLLRTVRDGDRLRMDGAQGTVKKLETP